MTNKNELGSNSSEHEERLFRKYCKDLLKENMLTKESALVFRGKVSEN